MTTTAANLIEFRANRENGLHVSLNYPISQRLFYVAPGFRNRNLDVTQNWPARRVGEASRAHEFCVYASFHGFDINED